MPFMKSPKVYFSACRLESWLTWIFSFALGSIIFTLPPIERFIPVFFAFALGTACIFVMNEYFDREADKNNKIKRTLPVASERIAPSSSLIFSSFLGVSSLILVLLTDIHLLPRFAIYLGLWTAYSAPVPNLKSVPILDFTISGLGAGFLPFYIGLGTAHRLDVGISLVLPITVPLMLYQSGGHIIQAVGDYRADRDLGLRTFAVKYGLKRATALAGLFFLLAFLSPFTYLFFGLLQPIYLVPVSLLLPLFLPAMGRFMDLYKNPSQDNVINLQKTARNVGILAMIVIWIYVLNIKAL